jgi:hypothetical protein
MPHLENLDGAVLLIDRKRDGKRQGNKHPIPIELFALGKRIGR